MEPNTPDTGIMPINHRLKSEASITLLFQLFSIRYKPIRIKTKSKTTSVIKVATMKNTDDFAKEAIMCNHQIDSFRCQQR